jgi:hypothetical protein
MFDWIKKMYKIRDYQLIKKFIYQKLIFYFIHYRKIIIYLYLTRFIFIYFYYLSILSTIIIKIIVHCNIKIKNNKNNKNN